jgi:nucleotide-binding universal stress UspA family protein
MTMTTVGMPIVVGVDGSTSARHAALWAAGVAARRHHPLRLVFACDSYAFGYAGGLAPPQSYFDELQAAGELLLSDVETEIRRSHPGLEIAVEQQTAGPIPILIEQSVGARLLVLGSRGSGGFHGILAGSTAVALVAHGHCPVAVVRGAEPDAVPPAEGPVVVGVDGSANSDAAVASAFDEASWRGAELVALHSWLEYTSDTALPRRFDAEWAQLEQREEELLAERLAGWQEKYPDVAVRRVITQGRPVKRLLEHAVGAQLIVVGSRGHGGFSGMLLGSTSQALIYHAPCPLLVVRPNDG